MKKSMHIFLLLLILTVMFFTCGTYITNAAKASVDNVTSLKAEQTTSSITLSWKKVSGADGYRITKKVDGKWVEYGTTKATAFVINGLSPATKHHFGVRAYKNNKNETVLSKKGNAITVGTLPSNVSGLKSTVKDKTLKLTWKKVTKADGYIVYKYNNAKSKWETVEKIKATSYSFKNLKGSGSLSFAVRAYCKINGKTLTSPNYTKIKYTLPVELKPVSVKTGSSAFRGEEILIVDIDGSNWSGELMSNTQSLPAYIDGNNTGKNVKCTINDKPDGANNYTITVDVSKLNLKPGSVISISFPEGFIKNKEGTQYSRSFSVSSTY